MKRRLLIVLAVLLVLAVTLVPAALGFYLTLRTSAAREHARLGVYADAAMLRVELVSGQFSHALLDMQQLTTPPCSPEHIASVRAIAFRNRYVQDAGVYDKAGNWLCSSLAGVVPPGAVHMAEPEWTGLDGMRAWLLTPRLLGAVRPMLVIGQAGNYVAIDPLSLVDVIDARDDGIAVFNTDTGRLVAANSVADPRLMMRVYQQGRAELEMKRIYAIRRSQVWPLAVVVSEPRQRLAEVWRNSIWGWLGAGLLIGGCFAFLVIRSARYRLSIEGELEAAIRRREIAVQYQPIVELATRRCVGAEALARWHHRGTAISPDIFIELAERHGLIQSITDLVLDRVIAELGGFLRSHPDCYVSINVSAVDLTSRRFLDYLGQRLNGTGIEPAQIRIEATERGFVDAQAAVQVIQAFREAGHPVYIDDFGTGYSSLSYLQTLPVDALKIDKSFVDTIGYEAASSSVAPHIIGLAQTLGLDVVAEGVEHEEQAAYLYESGARFAQGWLFSPALSAEAFMRFVEAGPPGSVTARSTGTGKPGRGQDEPPPGVPSSARSRA
ncbi:EAL domain-containing protein [Pararobbsia alpina]|uniref:cyclic-guanylate-specific phosphodiesterase n=1 Tax=Pararobbsia alpina TaxID=621374 RepID=A0A6S7C6K3_9BURK|nr:EAL domain-containing protein [Pararobbsia alpina]CAB3802436.1 putative cyclic di-GMP phosphodiesterase PdeB [Pararobbsia alpina]